MREELFKGFSVQSPVKTYNIEINCQEKRLDIIAELISGDPEDFREIMALNHIVIFPKVDKIKLNIEI
jgi:hypothetical protein